ncbi:MAG: nicotinate phosphoribosyltransferase [Sandaracinaceae bacterium]|nr:nicotinate phosphoribosyltransferase [Sandaracinaceae bacterium]
MAQLQSLLIEDADLGVATDLYQLTMMAAYRARGLTGDAVFELFVRKLPPGRAWVVAAGLEQALAYLERLSFDREHVEWLRSLPVFAHVDSSFFEWLCNLRFTGTVEAIPEGRVVFPNEPLLRVRAPIEQAQLVETFLLATLNMQSLIAAKAARVRIAAKDKRVVDFGARRAHGFGAALYATRASWIAGLDGTSNVLAAARLGIPVLGTAAHAYIMSFAREEDAFHAYHALYPDHCTLLVDTYDTLEGCRKATAIGPSLKGIRIDSGDLGALARGCRAILDEAGLSETKIVLSGDLNEDKIEALLAEGVPVDSFGVGTELVTSRDQPALGGVYKLVERIEGGARVPVMKKSEGKVTWPGAKQVWRSYDPQGMFLGDVIELAGAGAPAGAEPLLVKVMEAGRTIAGPEILSLASARERCTRDLARLPEGLRRLKGFDAPPVTIGPALRALAESL